jgi:mRNA-degrading endonuclease RelE of RelBE toxin-antitoxin system
MKILASDQVQAWLAALPPDTKKRVRVALRDLAGGHGDLKALHSGLEGWCRLRVGGLRIVYRSLPGKIIRLDYADTRDVVYENFLHRVARKQTGKHGKSL